MTANRAIMLLSGGLDSVVSLAFLKDKYSDIFALFFDYSQKSFLRELNAVKNITEYYSLKYEPVKLDWLGKINNIKVSDNINKEWVPNRNALFINIAACFAEGLGYNDIIIGANKDESVAFIDNSVEFINAVNETLKFSVNKTIQVKAPLINMSKTDIVRKGIELNIPFNLIYSCYSGTEKHCGECESCLFLKDALKNCKKDDIIEKIFC